MKLILWLTLPVTLQIIPCFHLQKNRHQYKLPIWVIQIPLELKAIQYRITDNIADPEGQDEYYSEELCRLPGCFLTYKPDENSPDVSEPPVIKNAYITFGSFNNLAKINDSVIETWCEMLKKLPDSRLLIKNPSLTDVTTRETYLEKFRQFGI